MTPVYIIVRSGQGDIWYDLITQEQWDAWPESGDESDPGEYAMVCNGETFFSLTDLWKHCRKKNLEIKGDRNGGIY